MSTEFSGQTEGMPTTPLLDSLPHTFANGAVFHGFSAQCDACAGTIGIEQMIGTVQGLAGNRCILTAHALCGHCHHLCRYHYLLDADSGLAATRLDPESAAS